MRILICGARDWNHPEDIDAFVKSLPKDTVIIEGECRGADIQARLSAMKYKLTVERYPAHWEKYGKVAGVLRNTEMLETGKPDLIVAFHDNLTKSKGTLNMINQAIVKGVPIRVYRHLELQQSKIDVTEKIRQMRHAYAKGLLLHG